VHRIGRTARAGDSGMAITFVSPDEQYLFENIESFLQKKIYRIPVPVELGDAPEYNPANSKKHKGSKRTSSAKKGNTKAGANNKKEQHKSAQKQDIKQDSGETKVQDNNNNVPKNKKNNRKRNNQNRDSNPVGETKQQSARKPQGQNSLKPQEEGKPAIINSKPKKLVKKIDRNNNNITATKKDTLKSNKETPKESSETGKKKRWSWWPFGKK
jgi:ATP-dependent RNA helicase RhlE